MLRTQAKLSKYKSWKVMAKAEDRQRIRRRFTEKERLRMVELYKAHASLRSIAKEFDCNHSIVSKLMCKWKKFHSTEDRPRSGRPPILSCRTLRILQIKLKKGELSTSRDMQMYLKHSFNIVASRSTVRNWMKELK